MPQTQSPDRFRTIPKETIRVGERPLYDICTKRGDLIWKRGQEITQEVFEQLSAREFFYDTECMPAGKEKRERERVYERPDTSLATALRPFPRRLDNLFGELLGGTTSDIQGEVFAFVDQLSELCDRDAAALFGLLHLDTEHPDYLIHPLQAATLCQLLVEPLGLPREQALCLTAAALTQDLGSLQLMKKLERAPSTVTKEQIAALGQHPAEGAKLLASRGVRNRDWLKAVICHHEGGDGKQTNYGLHGDAIPLHARIIAAADNYILINKPGGKNGKEFPPLVEMWKSHQFPNHADPLFMELIADRLGAVPPGTLVVLDLKKGQDPNYIKNPIAVVVKPNEQIKAEPVSGAKDAKLFPNVCTINDNGKPAIALKSADLYLQQRRIVKLLHPRQFTDYNKELELHQFWD